MNNLIYICLYSLSGNNIKSKGASLLFKTLQESNSTLKSVNLGLNLLDDECMNALGEFVKHSKYLEQVHIGYNNISDKGIAILSTYIIGNETLNVIGLWECIEITNKSLPDFIKMIESSCIGIIDIRATSISDNKILMLPLLRNILRHRKPRIQYNER